jgi:trans-aconitate 2-methyltransferase
MTYEFDGRKYEASSAHQKEWGERLIAELSLRGDERILDLGCGDGKLTAQLAELVPEGSVLGIDASSGMIEVAQKYQKENLSFLLLDINSLDFEDEFDLVFSNATVHWVKDHNGLLRKVWRSLRNDGAVRFNFAGAGNCSHLSTIVKTAMTKPHYAKYFFDFVWPWFMPTIEEYETIVRQFPFRDIRVWTENADRYFSDSKTMTRWIEQPSLVPFLKCIDQSDKQSFRDFVVQRMIEETRQDDGTCFETFRRINVYARK